MIKLIATDLDGTLFYPKRRFSLLTPFNKKLLIDYHKAGGQVVLVTGRNVVVSMKVQKKVRFPLAVLGCNGAFIYEDGKYTASYPIEKKQLMELYMEMRSKYGIVGWFIFDNTDIMKIAATNAANYVRILAPIGNSLNFAYAEKFVVSEQAVIDSIVNNSVYKVMPVFGLTKRARDKQEAAYIALTDYYKGKLTIKQANQAMEITSFGVNKAKTLEAYIASRGIRKEEVAVFGDSDNDSELIEDFQNSFAMESGQEGLKKKAAHIVKRVSDARPFLLNEDGTLR
jgi:Cof subfamily protein (haloacid dehalogenase superfamily)